MTKEHKPNPARIAAWVQDHLNDMRSDIDGIERALSDLSNRSAQAGEIVVSLERLQELYALAVRAPSHIRAGGTAALAYFAGKLHAATETEEEKQ